MTSSQRQLSRLQRWHSRSPLIFRHSFYINKISHQFQMRLELFTERNIPIDTSLELRIHSYLATATPTGSSAARSWTSSSPARPRQSASASSSVPLINKKSGFAFSKLFFFYFLRTSHNRVALIRHQCKKTTTLSSHRCLINT